MVSRADADGSAPWPGRVRFVTQAGAPRRAGAPRSRRPRATAGRSSSPSASPRDFLADRPGDAIVFVPGAVGGTSFWNHRWNPGDDLYDNLVALTRGVLAAHPGWRLRALLFQGFETDAKNGMLTTTFRRALDRFVKAIRADLGDPTCPSSSASCRPPSSTPSRRHAAIRDEVAARDAAPALHRRRVEPRRRASPRTTACTTRRPASSRSAAATRPALAAAEANAPAAAGPGPGERTTA